MKKKSAHRLPDPHDSVITPESTGL